MACVERTIKKNIQPPHNRWRHFWRFWIQPALPLRQVAGAIRGYARYLSDWSLYQKLPGADRLSFDESYPCLFDATAQTPFDAHYFYQAIWAAEHIQNNPAPFHVDIGSDVRFVGLMAVYKPVLFVDLRPLHAGYSRLISLSGDLLALPFERGSIHSLSCLHVVEHVGLGRYGDRLDPAGTLKACAELSRALAPGGELYLSLPVGRQRVQFNAHRIHTPQQVVEALSHLHLVSFSAVTDNGAYQVDASLDAMADAQYGCGLFHFRK